MIPADTSAAPWDGVPENPEQDGAHWLSDEEGAFVAHWDGASLGFYGGGWDNAFYIGPVLTPEEHAALLAERAALVARVEAAERDLGLINDLAKVLFQSVQQLEAALATARREGAADMKAAAKKAARSCGRPVGAGDGYGTRIPGTSSDAERAIDALPLPGDEPTNGTSE